MNFKWRETGRLELGQAAVTVRPEGQAPQKRARDSKTNETGPHHEI
ncbi:MAG: hypothetical protein HQK59_17640 [Deltaproteobacteria bacterium]|nr:hypothetical protein [Deltaproteobacteria bacterium]